MKIFGRKCIEYSSFYVTVSKNSLWLFTICNTIHSPQNIHRHKAVVRAPNCVIYGWQLIILNTFFIPLHFNSIPLCSC